MDGHWASSKDSRLSAALRHVELLTGSGDTPVWFRAFADVGKNRACRVFGTILDQWSEIERLQASGCGIFIVVNEGGNSAAEITRVRALFVDGDGVPTPTTWHAEPDFIVRRDLTHWHAYWLIADMRKDDFKTAQKRLAAQYATDPKVCDLPRVMRLAGTLHLKDPDRQFLITIEASGHARNPRNARRSVELLGGLPLDTAAKQIPTERTMAARRTAAKLPTGEAVSLEILRAMLAHLDPGCDRNEWRDIIAAIRAAPVPGDDDESGRREIAHQWSAGHYYDALPGNYTGPSDVDRVFDDFEPPQPGDAAKIHFGSLVMRARGAGYVGAISIREADARERFRTIAKEITASEFMARVIAASQGAIKPMPKRPEYKPSSAFVEMAKRIVAEERRRGEDLARCWGLK